MTSEIKKSYRPPVWNTRRSVGVNTEYTLDKDSILLGYPLTYNNADFKFLVNGTIVLSVSNAVQGNAVQVPITLPLNKGDKLKVTGSGQYLNCYLYDM